MSMQVHREFSFDLASEWPDKPAEVGNLQLYAMTLFPHSIFISLNSKPRLDSLALALHSPRSSTAPSSTTLLNRSETYSQQLATKISRRFGNQWHQVLVSAEIPTFISHYSNNMNENQLLCGKNPSLILESLLMEKLKLIASQLCATDLEQEHEAMQVIR